MPSGRQLGILRWRHAINHPPAWLTTIFIWDRCRAPSSALGGSAAADRGLRPRPLRAERPLPPPQASWQNYQPDRSFIRTGDRNPLLIVQLENPGVPFRGFPFSESGALWPEQGSCPAG